MGCGIRGGGTPKSEPVQIRGGYLGEVFELDLEDMYK